MATPKLFVSYSHRDAEALEQLGRFLKTLERDGLLDAWTDQRLEGGDDWRAEIGTALDEATAAVVFVSQDFLASDFIYAEELPRLLAAADAGRLTLIPVFLSPSNVADLDVPFTAAGGEEKREKLTRFQGHGTPEKTLADMGWSERERIFSRLAHRLKELGGIPEPPAAAHRPGGRRPATAVEPARVYELTVELERRGESLETRYRLPGREPMASFARPWAEVEATLAPIAGLLDGDDRRAVQGLVGSAAAGCGQALFGVLFADASRWAPVLRAVFNRPEPKPRPNPVWAGVRLRVATREPLLTTLPWRLTAWHGQLLAHGGWVFFSSSATDPTADFTTTAPASVLIVAPEKVGGAPAWDSTHPRAVAELVRAVWPTGQEPGFVRRARTRQQLANALRGMRPHLLYVYAATDEAGSSLLLDGDGGSEPLAAGVLRGLFREAGHHPAVVYLNTAPGASGSAAAAAALLNELLGDDVPLVVRRRLGPWEADSTSRAVAWLRRWLGAGEDPVAALHPAAADDRQGPEAATLVAHAAYRSWKTFTFRPPRREHLPGLRLDRDHQKALVRKHLVELARSDSRRLLALVAYAAPGNAAATLHEQLRDYLDLEFAGRGEIDWQVLELPSPRRRLRQDLEHDLRLQLAADVNEPVAHLLRRHGPRVVAPGKRAVLWLHWGACGEDTDLQEPLKPAQLGDWLRFCAEYLASRCPDDLRLVASLAIETETARHARLAKVLQEHRRRPWARHPSFRLTTLPPLGEVPEEELLDFLEDPDNSSCDPQIQAEAAERLIGATGGEFDALVALMEEAENSSWYDLLARLRREQGEDLPEDEEPL